VTIKDADGREWVLVPVEATDEMALAMVNAPISGHPETGSPATLELVEALRTARDYVFCELETERQQMKGYERISRIDEIAADLAEIDAALAKAGVK